jgi:hypothetical protein
MRQAGRPRPLWLDAMQILHWTSSGDITVGLFDCKNHILRRNLSPLSHIISFLF